MYNLLVGVDVSKDFFSAAGLDEEGKEHFSGTYEMNSHGFSEFLKALSSHGERLDQMIVAMESTGCYHINLFSFLSSQRNPYGRGESSVDFQFCEAFLEENEDR
jgi:transposase